MSSTLLEVTRASHEEVERLERIIVKDLQTEPPTNKDRLCQSHRVRNMIEQITSTTHKLIEIYEDNDNARKDEIAALGGQSSTGANVNVFSAFYDRLKEIREYHRRHPAARYVDTTDEFEQLLKEEPVIEFTGEEAFGRYLDLHELYNDYINSKFGKQIEYSVYLDIFSQSESIPRKMKLTRQYKEYLQKLLEYLIYFFERTEPLQDLERIFSKVEFSSSSLSLLLKASSWLRLGDSRTPCSWVTFQAHGLRQVRFKCALAQAQALCEAQKSVPCECLESSPTKCEAQLLKPIAT